MTPAETQLARRPGPLGAALAVVGFLVFIVLELAVYEKGVGRALWVSALAAVVLFAIGYWFARATTRSAR